MFTCYRSTAGFPVPRSSGEVKGVPSGNNIDLNAGRQLKLESVFVESEYQISS